MKLPRSPHLARSALAALTCALVLAACDSKPTFRNTDITGADVGHALALTDHTGAKRTLGDYRGKVVALFFGYTQCPDVCPTTLVELAEIMKTLGPDADRVQVLFATVDPERDTPQVLAHYVPAFDRRFVGLSGSADEVAAAAKQFKVFYQKVPGTTPGAYTMDHTAALYLLDPAGQPRVFVRYGQNRDAIAADIKTLLRG